MNTLKYLVILFVCSMGLSGCIKDGQRVVYTSFTPVLLSTESLVKSVVIQSAVPITVASKIYYKGGFIYISERLKGVHIIDNTNPTSPVNKTFIAIPGCLDMAIKNNVLYVDNAIDLVAINLLEAEKGNLQIVKRIPNVFPEPAPPDGGAIPVKFLVQNRPANTIIIDWKQ
jgi:hypothetical protein